MEKGAKVSKSGKYRYRLWRIWDTTKPTIAFIMLNPSTADAEHDDPTIRRCINFAKSWGYGGLYVVNLFAYRATNPNELKLIKNPVGKKNNKFILETIKHCDKVVAAWGNHGAYLDRNLEVLNMIGKAYYLKLSKSNNPCHPLYLKKSLTPKLLGL